MGIYSVGGCLFAGRKEEPYHRVNCFAVRDTASFKIQEEDPDHGDDHQPDGWRTAPQPGLEEVKERSPPSPMQTSVPTTAAATSQLGASLSSLESLQLSKGQAQQIKEGVKMIARVLKDLQKGTRETSPPRNISVPPAHPGSLECTVCGRHLANSATLKRHMKRHRQTFKYTCKDCGKGFQLKGELKQHQLGHGTELQCPVGQCGAILSSRKAYNTHMADHRKRAEKKGARVKCRFCDKTYSHQRYTKSHEKDCPENPEYQGPFVCLYRGCNRSYVAQKERTRHHKEHQ